MFRDGPKARDYESPNAGFLVTMAGEYHEAKKKQRDFEAFLPSLAPFLNPGLT